MLTWKPSDLRFIDGRLCGRTWWWRAYEPIEPDAVKEVKEVLAPFGWRMCRLVVRTNRERYEVSGTRGDYDCILSWISQYTALHPEETLRHKVFRGVYRTPLRQLVAAAWLWLKTTMANARKWLGCRLWVSL